MGGRAGLSRRSLTAKNLALPEQRRLSLAREQGMEMHPRQPISIDTGIDISLRLPSSHWSAAANRAPAKVLHKQLAGAPIDQRIPGWAPSDQRIRGRCCHLQVAVTVRCA